MTIFLMLLFPCISIYHKMLWSNVLCFIHIGQNVGQTGQVGQTDEADAGLHAGQTTNQRLKITTWEWFIFHCTRKYYVTLNCVVAENRLERRITGWKEESLGNILYQFSQRHRQSTLPIHILVHVRVLQHNISTRYLLKL